MKPTGRVKRYALEILARMDERGIGLSYEEAGRLVRERYPEAKASVGSLRWYAHRARRGDKGFRGFPMPLERAP